MPRLMMTSQTKWGAMCWRSLKDSQFPSNHNLTFSMAETPYGPRGTDHFYKYIPLLILATSF